MAIKTYTYTNGNTADGGQVETDLTELYNNLDWTNFGASNAMIDIDQDFRFDNTFGVTFENAAGSLSALIKQNSSDNLNIQNPDGNVHIGGGARLRAYNASGGSDYLDLYHDNTDGVIGVGAGSILIDASGGDSIVRVANSSLGVNTDPSYRLHVNSGTNNVVALFESTDSTGGIALRDSTTTTDTYVRIQALGDALQFAAGNTNYGQLTSAGVFEIYDSTLADKITFEHDGTNGVVSSNAGQIRFEATADVRVADGTGLYINDASNVDELSLNHDGSNAVIATGGAGGGNLSLQPASNVHVSGGSRLRVYGSSGGSNYLDSYHDNTNAYINSAVGDLRLTAAGGDVQVRSGDDFEVYGPTNAGKIRFSHDDTDGLIFTDAGKIILNANNNEVSPDTDNDTSLGTASFRWKDVRSVLINGADIALQNNFLFREYPCTEEDVHTKSVEWMMEHANAGVQMLNQDGEVIAIFGKNGTLYVDEIKPLSEAAQELLA